MSGNKKIVLTAATYFFLTLIIFAFAAAGEIPFTLKYEFPCQNFPGAECPSGEETASNPAAYISRLYQFALAAAVMLSLGMLIFGGIQYIFSRGRPAEQSDANDRIIQALWGLVLLFGAYLILYTIDPELTKLKLPLEQKAAPNFVVNAEGKYLCGASGGTCPENYICAAKGICEISRTIGDAGEASPLPPGLHVWVKKNAPIPKYCKIINNENCPIGAPPEGHQCCEIISS